MEAGEPGTLPLLFTAGTMEAALRPAVMVAAIPWDTVDTIHAAHRAVRLPVAWDHAVPDVQPAAVQAVLVPVAGR